jgi:ABC-type nickel/cobalt efflux system permease component RcnA
MIEIFSSFQGGSTAAVLGLGFLIGLKHATEADHLAAVSTIVSERESLFSSAIVGGLWGLGHTLSLIVAGIFVLLLDFRISENTERWLEFSVGVMLTLLGLNVLRKLINGGKVHFHVHDHDGTDHKHVHPHVHESPKTHSHAVAHEHKKASPRALLIGMVHGMAGSAALMIVLIPTIDSKLVGLLYIVVFGLGSIGGMMIMSFIVGLPFHITKTRSAVLFRGLQMVAGFASLVVGSIIISEKFFAIEG